MQGHSNIKAELVGPYLDYIMQTENPSDKEIGEIFDRIYDMEKEELRILNKIYKAKLQELEE